MSQRHHFVLDSASRANAGPASTPVRIGANCCPREGAPCAGMVPFTGPNVISAVKSHVENRCGAPGSGGATQWHSGRVPRGSATDASQVQAAPTHHQTHLGLSKPSQSLQTCGAAIKQRTTKHMAGNIAALRLLTLDGGAKRRRSCSCACACKGLRWDPGCWIRKLQCFRYRRRSHAAPAQLWVGADGVLLQPGPSTALRWRRFQEGYAAHSMLQRGVWR